MFKQAFAVTAIAALAACGGGGGESTAEAPVAAAPVKVEPQPLQTPAARPIPAPPVPVNPNCYRIDGHTECDLFASTDAIGVGVPANSFVRFTNNTGVMLQIDRVEAYTGERANWSEYCAYLAYDHSQAITGQKLAGVGEVGCAHKGIGEDYPALTWGEWSGLLVMPGQQVFLNSHTEPSPINHTYSLRVRVATTGLYSWRQPQIDQVNECNGNSLSTKWTPWRNDTGRALSMSGAEVYAVSANPAAPGAVAAACVHVLDVNGSVRWSNCEVAARGSVNWPAVEIQPGESVAAQASHSCAAPGHWGWATWLRIH